MANPSTPAASKQLIVSLGDVTLDWLEEATPRRQPGPTIQLRNYQLFPGYDLTCVWGGAALVGRLLRSAIEAWRLQDRFEVDRTLEARLPPPYEPAARQYLQSLAIVKQMPGDGNPVRVELFKGFMAGAATAGTTTITVAPVPSVPVPPRCLVVDDAANGCRDDADFVREFENLARATTPLLIVLKLSRPLEHSCLIDALTSTKTADNRRVVVVVNAHDLRAQGIHISRRLSWERSATDLISICDEAKILRGLREIGDVLVRFGNDGCIVLPHKGERFLVFDPRRAEDGFDQELPGTMPGATSAFVADLTAALLSDMDLEKATKSALAVARKILKAGFTRTPATKKVADYPLNVFDGPPPDGHKSDFSGITLPNASDAQNWRILSTRINQGKNLREIAETIVRRGLDDADLDFPIAQLGNLMLVDTREIEGYRSIENLMGEYIRSMHGGKPKPLAIGVFGPPGSGKSFGIEEIAKNLKGAHVTFAPLNLTQFEGPQDLTGAFHAARDESLRGRLPLLFFDEFDCSYNKEPWGWLKFFLAPMQDGEFKDNGRLHPLGHAIFVFTGGIAGGFDQLPIDVAEFKNAKGPDFVSRLKGYVDVQGINPPPRPNGDPGEVDPESIMRRAILLRSMLLKQTHRTRNMNPIIRDKNTFDIDDAVLAALLNVKRYRYGARSLESILLMSHLMDRDHFGVASLPSAAQLAMHVDDSFMGILITHTHDR